MSWTVVVYFDGEPVTGPVPCDDWTVGSIVAESFATGGRPVSIAQAVVAARPVPEPDELFPEAELDTRRRVPA